MATDQADARWEAVKGLAPEVRRVPKEAPEGRAGQAGGAHTP